MPPLVLSSLFETDHLGSLPRVQVGQPKLMLGKLVRLAEMG
jgi:hypothetical protein